MDDCIDPALPKANAECCFLWAFIYFSMSPYRFSALVYNFLAHPVCQTWCQAMISKGFYSLNSYIHFLRTDRAWKRHSGKAAIFLASRHKSKSIPKEYLVALPWKWWDNSSTNVSNIFPGYPFKFKAIFQYRRIPRNSTMNIFNPILKQKWIMACLILCNKFRIRDQ